MNIRDLRSDVPRTGGTRQAGPSAEPRTETDTDPGRTPRHDRVEISTEGRARAAEVASPDGSLPPERLAEIRRRIADGVYDTDEVLGAVARRILQSGDLDR